MARRSTRRTFTCGRPGIFYVFRDPRDAQGFRAKQFAAPAFLRQRVSEALFDTHRQLLDDLCAFIDVHGRLPERDELAHGPDLVTAFGSIRNAFTVVRRITGEDRWSVARSAAEKNLLVYLALTAFSKRPKMSELPDDLQRDIRFLFGSYRTAVLEADRLLFATGRQEELDAAIKASPVGKVFPTRSMSTSPCWVDFLRYSGFTKDVLRSLSGPSKTPQSSSCKGWSEGSLTCPILSSTVWHIRSLRRRFERTCALSMSSGQTSVSPTTLQFCTERSFCVKTIRGTRASSVE